MKKKIIILLISCLLLSSVPLASMGFAEGEVILSATDSAGDWFNEGLSAWAAVEEIPSGSSGRSLLGSVPAGTDASYLYLGSTSGFEAVNAVEAGLDASKAAFSFWLYLGSTEIVKSGYCRFELTSGGHPDREADQILISDLNGGGLIQDMVNGWNHIVVRLSSQVAFDRVNYFRWFINQLGDRSGFIFGLHELKLIESDLPVGAHVVETEEKTGLEVPCVPAVEPGDTLLPAQIMADASSSAKWQNHVLGVYSGEAPEGNAVLAASWQDVQISWAGDPFNATGAGFRQEYAVLSLWLYVSNPDGLSTLAQFELGSSGTFDDPNEYRWDWTEEFLYSLDDGWNKIELKIPFQNGVHYEGTVDFGALNYFRLYNISTSGAYDAEMIVLMSDLKLGEEGYDPSDWDESFMRVADRMEMTETPSKSDIIQEEFETPYNSVQLEGSAPSPFPDVKTDPTLNPPSDALNIGLMVAGIVLLAAGLLLIVLKLIQRQKR